MGDDCTHVVHDASVEPVPLLVAATDNLIGWHDCSVRAIGFVPRRTEHWWGWSPAGPSIFFTAIQVEPAPTRSARQAAESDLRRHLDDRHRGFDAVCVSYADLDLGRQGLAVRTNGLWYARAPGPIVEPAPAEGLEIVSITTAGELAEFESATTAAFGSPPPAARFDIHAPGVLDDPRMHVLIGRHQDEVVCGAMAYVDEAVVGLYGVGTVPGHRGRGWGRLITERALAVAPDRPAVLQPSPAAARMYRRMGFAEIGRFTHWA
jgi:GNAT superfamily N-acetyltransferase